MLTAMSLLDAALYGPRPGAIRVAAVRMYIVILTSIAALAVVSFLSVVL